MGDTQGIQARANGESRSLVRRNIGSRPPLRGALPRISANNQRWIQRPRQRKDRAKENYVTQTSHSNPLIGRKCRKLRRNQGIFGNELETVGS